MSDFIFVNGSRLKNFEGKKFGELTVGQFAYIKDRYAHWHYRCSCGNEIIRSVKHLSTAKHCGVKKNHSNRRDLTGQTFNYLKVLQFYTERNVRRQKYLCRCLLCGKTTVVSESNLVSGQTKSCGCMMQRDITNQKFGYLTALHPTTKRKADSIVWLFRCKCGSLAEFSVTEIRSGRRSCGCMKEIEKTLHTSVHHVEMTIKKRPNISGRTGVIKIRTGKWGAFIGYRGESKWLGTYERKMDAIGARVIAERQRKDNFGEWFKAFQNNKIKSIKKIRFEPGNGRINYIWDESYEMLKIHKNKYGLKGLYLQDPYLYSWLMNQIAKSRKGLLYEDQAVRMRYLLPNLFIKSNQ